jgi:hypothetical protein
MFAMDSPSVLRRKLIDDGTPNDRHRFAMGRRQKYGASDLVSYRARHPRRITISHAQPQELKVSEIAPGLFAHHGLTALMTRGNNGAIANVGFVIGDSGVAARFERGPDANVSEISTRVRVNNYTDVHAVAELSDGQLYMTKTYVKASGGCSAPAAKNADEAKARLARCDTRNSHGPARVLPAPLARCKS